MDIFAYFKARMSPPAAVTESTPSGAPVVAVLTTDAILAAASAKLAQAQVSARVAKAFVEAGAARAGDAIKLGKMSATEGVRLMRPRNVLAAATKVTAENAATVVNVARAARTASVAIAAIELSQVASDNPEATAALKAQEEEAKASGEWGCTRHLFIDVCGPTKQ